MPKYEIELSAKAIVSTKILIEANDDNEAHNKLQAMLKGKIIEGASSSVDLKEVNGLHNCPWECDGLDLNPELKTESFRKKE